jgi:cold shock CspA family protein
MDFFGEVVTWLDQRGFGFVRLSDGREVFCHSRALRHAGLGAGLPVGTRVECDIENGPDGRLRVARICERNC